MAGETDRLLKLAKELSPMPDPRELDVLVSTGEQVSVALLSMALLDMGRKARSFLGFQVPMQTDEAFSKARIVRIPNGPIHQALHEGVIPVVAGFQGVTKEGWITTLGRGGSDTTAVALGCAIAADVVEIYTDVDGVYTTDPNICPKAEEARQGFLRGDAGDGKSGRKGSSDPMCRVRHELWHAYPRSFEL